MSADKRASNFSVSVILIYRQYWLILTLLSSANTWSNSIYRFSADIMWRWELLSVRMKHHLNVFKFSVTELLTQWDLVFSCCSSSSAFLSASFCCHLLHLQLFFSASAKMLWYSAFSSVVIIFLFTVATLWVSYILLCIRFTSTAPQTQL